MTGVAAARASGMTSITGPSGQAGLTSAAVEPKRLR